MLQVSINPLMYRLPFGPSGDDHALCFTIVSFGYADFGEVKDEFPLTARYVLSDPLNCRVTETTRRFRALRFLLGNVPCA
jgi:hypothetical protein